MTSELPSIVRSGERQRRIAWVERREQRTKYKGGPATAVTVTGFKAAAAPTVAAAAATTTAANKRSTAAANTAVVATSYCQSAKATLPSAAATARRM